MADQNSPPPTFALPLRPLPGDREVMALAPGLSSAARSGLLSPPVSIEVHHDEHQFDFSPAPPRSAPANMQNFQSPMRHHRRTPSAHREIRETLNARFEYAPDDSDGVRHHRINQYVIKEEIGRGSYGAVHLATDQFGNEYVGNFRFHANMEGDSWIVAVKEFSKARLRKRAQSSLLRQGPGRPGRFPRPDPDAFNARISNQKAEEAKDKLFLIREEIAIMKKLNHPNLVQLIEVLDDPGEDSLYMVLEMCKKGVVMRVGLDESATPFPEETCRHWFRDLILGIEYRKYISRVRAWSALTAYGVVHRDIKPDNLLLTADDVLKISDFGVSEMFAKPEEMRTTKSAGSPAFLPPELCMARHGDISGKAADIWSMGVSLYCLRYGRIPFERDNVLEMYAAIKNEPHSLPPDENEQFVDVLSKLMEKDAEKRITMEQLREHSWVTRDGQDPLLSAEENCTDPVDLPNALEVNHAFTRKMTHLLCVMKAIRKFKGLLKPSEPLPEPSEPAPTKETDEDATPRPSPPPSEKQVEEEKTAEPVQESTADHIAKILKEREDFLKATGGRRGRPNPLSFVKSPPDRSGTLHLGIGTGGMDDFGREQLPADVVSESPTAVDFNIYNRAFTEEVERIKRSNSRKRGSGAGTVYHTRFTERNQRQTATDDSLKLVSGGLGPSASESTPRSELSGLAGAGLKGGRFADLVTKAMMDSKTQAQ
ncbi:hypothetical protein OQA88_177 [Cercophora sp. LCS_1]